MRNKWYLGIIVGVFLVLKLIMTFTTSRIPMWDEAVYVGMGKYIFSLGNNGLWEIIRPLGLPIVNGFFWKIGLNPLIMGEIIANLFAVGLLIAVYLLTKQVVKEKFAFLACLFLAINPLFYAHSSYILTAIPSGMFLMFSLYSYLKKKYVWVGVFSGLAFMFRFPTGLIILVFIIALCWKKKFLESVKYLVSFVVVSLPFFIFNYFAYRPFTKDAYDAIFRPIIFGSWHQYRDVTVHGLWNNIIYFLKIMFFDSPYIGFAIAALIGFILVKEYRRKESILWIFFAIFWGYFTIITHKELRYMMLFLPMVCVLATVGVVRLWNLKIKNKKILRIVVALAVIGLCVFSLISVNRYVSWRYDEEPEIVTKYYKYFEGKDNRVFTGDPVPAAYSDNHFVASYFMESEDIEAGNEWERDLEMDNIIYVDSPNYCLEGDDECQENYKTLFGKLMKKYELEFNFNSSYGDIKYYIFRA